MPFAAGQTSRSGPLSLLVCDFRRPFALYAGRTGRTALACRRGCFVHSGGFRVRLRTSREIHIVALRKFSLDCILLRLPNLQRQLGLPAVVPIEGFRVHQISWVALLEWPCSLPKHGITSGRMRRRQHTVAGEGSYYLLLRDRLVFRCGERAQTEQAKHV